MKWVMVLVTTVLVLVAVLGCALLLFPSMLRINRLQVIAQAISFPLVLAVLGLVAVILTGVALAVTGMPVWVALMLVFTIYTVLAAAKVSRLGFGSVVVAPDEAQATDLVILGWNVLGDSVPAETLRDAVLKYSPDMVGLPEATADYVAEVAALLTAGGYPMRGYNVGPKDGHDPHETGMLVRASYGEHTIRRLNVLGASTLVASPTVPDSPTFVAVHTVAPTLDRHAGWVKDLHMLADEYATASDTILVGDFNATAEHMHGLATASGAVLGNLHDAATQARAAAVGTWPAGKPVALGTQIDHVLHAPEYVTQSFQVLTELDGSGSDHRAILVHLRRR